MPWSMSDAPAHTKKADTPKRKRQFAKVANAVLAKTGNDATAIKIANAAVRRNKIKSQNRESKNLGKKK